MDEVARRQALAELYAIPGHLLWRATARVHVELDRILPPGTDIHTYAALVALAHEEPQSQSSLARVCAVSGTTLTSVAGTLERAGLVERIRNPSDRRSYALTRTDAGRAAIGEWAPHVRRAEQRITRSFSPEEATRLRAALVHVVGDELDPRTPAELLDSLGFLVTRAHQRAHKEFLAALRPLDLEPRHFGAMRALRAVGPSTQGQLSTLIDVSPATVVQMVDHLEALGLLERRRDEADRRAYALHLTPASDRVIAEATAIAAPLMTARFGPARGRARRDLIALLPRLLQDADDS